MQLSEAECLHPSSAKFSDAWSFISIHIYDMVLRHRSSSPLLIKKVKLSLCFN
jgi:hypothetical protein